ncbi:MAG TPA: cell division protein FtsZ [Polyangiaceae bacterium]|nr:cell division protein FtsZ [Polyangiaceae bacterium]
MSFSIEFADDNVSYDARIKVIGVGGSGGNAVNTMINLGLEGVEFVAVNTDAQALSNCLAPTKIQIGTGITRGLGAGADPERGRKAAIEDVNLIKEAIGDADMVFITAGMGGGTGTGAAPVIAQLAREEDILVVGVATKPFLFEGKQRARRAETGLEFLTDNVDTLVTIPNEKLLTLDDDDLSFVEAFRKADEVLYQAVKGISDLITQSGMVNVDFADVRTVMNDMGRALMGTGCAKGDGRARLAAELAVTSPLLDDISVDGATGVLINVVGGPDMKMREVSEAASLIQEQAHEDANIIFGATIDENMGDAIKVTVIATGFDAHEELVAEPAAQAVQSPAQQLARQSSRATTTQAPVATKRVVRQPEPELETEVAVDVDDEPRIEHVEEIEVPRRPRRRYVEEERRTAERSDQRSERARPRRVRSRDSRYVQTRGEEIDWDTPAYQRRRKSGS